VIFHEIHDFYKVHFLFESNENFVSHEIPRNHEYHKIHDFKKRNYLFEIHEFPEFKELLNLTSLTKIQFHEIH